MSKYRRWKREAKRLQAEYALLALRPFNAKAFMPMGYAYPDDAAPWIQRAIDHVSIGHGGTVAIPKGTHLIGRQGVGGPLGVNLSGETDE